jgi:hypothetical protein
LLHFKLHRQQRKKEEYWVSDGENFEKTIKRVGSLKSKRIQKNKLAS